MSEQLNIQLTGSNNKTILADVYWPNSGDGHPLVIFTHGFKGFKDWGHFSVIASEFASRGFVFVKFNFSHNGTTVESPMDFADLEAFGNNNFSKEMDDLGAVIDWSLSSEFPAHSKIDPDQVFLIGHSRGGGIVVLKAAEDARVKKIATWAGVCEFGRYWSDEQMAKWKADGVQYVMNGRTGQEMPLYYQMYEDYYAHTDRLHIPNAAKKLVIPHLIVHGTADEAVPYKFAEEMAGWNDRSVLFTVENGGHTFDGKHPWDQDALPEDSQQVVDRTIKFFSAD